MNAGIQRYLGIEPHQLYFHPMASIHWYPTFGNHDNPFLSRHRLKSAAGFERLCLEAFLVVKDLRRNKGGPTILSAGLIPEWRTRMLRSSISRVLMRE